MVLPDGPNQRWSLDFVSDTLTCSRRFRILCVVDDYTRECLALVATRRSRACGSRGS
jgi:putative transposase